MDGHFKGSLKGPILMLYITNTNSERGNVITVRNNELSETVVIANDIANHSVIGGPVIARPLLFAAAQTPAMRRRITPTGLHASSRSRTRRKATRWTLKRCGRWRSGRIRTKACDVAIVSGRISRRLPGAACFQDRLAADVINIDDMQHVHPELSSHHDLQD